MSPPQTIDVRTTTREEMVDVTALVRAAIRKAGLKDGLVCVFCPHTTAGVTIQENSDPTVKSDMVAHMARLVPKDAGFQHSEDNSDAHIKASLIGSAVTLIVDGGRPLLGHWQALFLCEFDGPRERRIVVKAVP